MGFRFKRFDYVGGVSPWSGGSSTSDQAARSQAVCKDFADFIISCDKGWSLDTARNATTSDFVSVPMWDISGNIQSFSAPSLFFRNTNGAKLFMCIAGFIGSSGIALGTSNLLQLTGGFSIMLFNGIIFSMIPSGSQSEFGNTFDDTFLPSDATRIYGTIQSYENSARDKGGFIAVNGTNINYTYGLFVDSYCVGVGGISSDIDANMIFRPGYFVGRIIGTLAHEESTNQSKYGIIRFWDCNSPYQGSGNREFYLITQFDYYDISSSVTSIRTYGNSFVKNNIYTGGDWSSSSSKENQLRKACGGGIFNAAGNWLDGRNGANIRYFPSMSAEIVGNSVLSSSVISGSQRWVPFEIASCSNDLSTDGIVTGDGFKGYLDTDLFRCAQCNLNQLYANGAFIGADATYNLLLGWDPNNTDTL